MLKEKKGLILGLANDKSIAFAVAKKFVEEGAEVIGSYLNNLYLTDKIALYPGVGENLGYLKQNQINLDFLYRSLDRRTNPYCKKGFFNFKNYIPKIVSEINI